MLHSNCKQVKDAIREHIDNRVYIEDNDNATLSEKIKYMDTCFKEFYKYEKFHTPDYYGIYKNGNTCSLMTGKTCFQDYSLKEIKIRLRELLRELSSIFRKME